MERILMKAKRKEVDGTYDIMTPCRYQSLSYSESLHLKLKDYFLCVKLKFFYSSKAYNIKTIKILRMPEWWRSCVHSKREMDDPIY